MSATDRLDQIEARANAATEGPWVVDDTDEGWMVIQDPEAGIEPMTPEDADLMAAARTDVPALVAALRAVLALDMGHSANNPHAYCISPLALRRAIEEALS